MSHISAIPARRSAVTGAASMMPPVALEAQRTLFGSAQCTGIGVHSGKAVTLRLLPAAADTGIVFIRTDLPTGQNRIVASWDKVVDTRLCTVLGNEHGATIGTVEHLLSALRALDIDNAVIEVDGPEVPIMDGSAAPFVLLIEMAGVQEQDSPRQWLEILRPVTVTQEGKTASLLPGDQSVFSVAIDFEHQAIGQQNYDCTITAPGFKGEVSRARTFGFVDDVERLRKAGLARGGSLHNAVVLDADKVLNEGGLRYADEFARHKLLDAIGDLSLAGAPIRGHFTGHCTGHALNNKLLHALFADARNYRLVNRPDPAHIADLAAAE